VGKKKAENSLKKVKFKGSITRAKQVAAFTA
jgi:hypothetical protein